MQQILKKDIVISLTSGGAVQQQGKSWACAALMGLALVGANALENQWVGAGGDLYWTNAANWSLGVLPDDTHRVLISDLGTNSVLLDDAATVQSFYVGPTTAGAVLTIAGGTLNCLTSGQVASNSALVLAGTLNCEQLTNSGTVTWTSGQYNVGETVVRPLGEFNISVGAAALHGSFLNQGTVHCISTNLLCSSEFQFNNMQTLVLHTNVALTPVPNAALNVSLHNNGVIQVPENLGAVRLNVGFVVYNLGSLLAGTNSVLEISTTNGGYIQLNDGNVFGGAGVVRFVEGTGEIVCEGGMMQVNGTVELAGAVLNAAQVRSVFWEGSGKFRWLSGTLSEFLFAPGLVVEMSGAGEKVVRGICDIFADVDWLSVGPLLIDPVDPGNLMNWGNFFLKTNCILGLKSGGSAIPRFDNFGTMRVEPNSGEVNLLLATELAGDGQYWVGSNSVLVVGTTNNGRFNIQHEAEFAGPGVTRLVEGSGEMTCDGDVYVNGTLELAGAKLELGAVWRGTGLFRWLSGSVSQLRVFNPAFQLEMVGPGEKILRGLCETVCPIQWRSGGPLLLSRMEATEFINRGQFLLETNCTLGVTAGGFDWPRMENWGAIAGPDNKGTLSLQVGVQLENLTTISTGTNTVLEVGTTNGGSLELRGFATIDGPGLLRLVPGSNPVTGEAVLVNGTVELAGADLYMNSQEWSGPGLFRWLSGSIWDGVFATGFHLELAGSDDKVIIGDCINRGEFKWKAGGARLTSTMISSAFLNQGEFILETNCLMLRTSHDLLFENSGTVRVPADAGAVRLTLGQETRNLGTLLAGTNSVFEIGTTNAGDFNAQTGTVFEGAGLFRLVPGVGSVGCSGPVLVNGTVELAGADLYMNGAEWSGLGLFRWLSGVIVEGRFGSGFHVEMVGAGDKVIANDLINRGEVKWQAGGAKLTSAANPAAFLNQGNFILETNCLVWPGGGSFLFENSGTVRVPADAGVVRLTLGQETRNTGSLVAETNSVFEIGRTNGGTFFAQTGTVFGGSGIVRLTGPMGCEGTMTVNGTVELAGGDVYMSPGTWSGPGLLRWLSGSIGDVFTFAPGFRVELASPGDKSIDGVCTNFGQVQWLDNSSMSIRTGGSSAKFINGGLFTQDAGGFWEHLITFSNRPGGVFAQESGRFKVGQFHNAGMLKVSGGVLNPAFALNFYSNSTCQFVMGAAAPQTNYWFASFGLAEAVDITLGGNLQVVVTNGFVPTAGTNYLLIWDGGWGYQINGQFSQIQLPTLPDNLVWQPASSPGLLYLQTLQLVSLANSTLLPDGSFQFAMSGGSSGTFEIQASTNLVHWQILTNGSLNGPVVFTDSQATNYAQRFYRGVVSP